jgi:3-hydroxybutyryl-CoA dehydrogenase
MSTMENIAVIGAGVMGSDVALNLACHGHQVILKDLSEGLLEQARQRIIKDFRMMQMLAPRLKDKKVVDVLDHIIFTTNYTGFTDVSYCIENISEDWQQKHRVYLQLREVCPDETVVCVNTSCISITRIAALMPRPDRIIGMHFMNPVYLKEMVELVRGFHTSEATIEAAKELLRGIGKTSVLVNDFPGFVANRLSHLFMNEAAFIIQDRVAAAREVDTIFKKGYGHSMGPLETADLIGLDTVVNSLDILYDSYQDSKFRCCPLLRKMVDAGLLGKKSGEGFYKYQSI